MDFIELGMIIADKDLQLKKHWYEREVREFGIDKDSRLKQFWKHLFPIKWIDFDIIMFVSKMQLRKQSFPKKITESGILTILRLLQFWKHLSGKHFAIFGNSASSINRFKMVTSPLVILKLSDMMKTNFDYDYSHI
jgi:hypothetical protein